MPCYSRVSSSIEFGDKTDAGLLGKAMTALGYITGRAGQALRFRHPETGVDGLYQNGQLTVYSGAAFSTDQVNEIKRAYSTEVVKSAAQRFGWQVKQSSPTQLQATRRF